MDSKIRVLKTEFLNDGSGKKYVELAGPSTVAKPVKDFYATGSLFFETGGDVYMFDEDDGWGLYTKLGGDS